MGDGCTSLSVRFHVPRTYIYAPPHILLYVCARFVVRILHVCGQLAVWAEAFGTTSALGATSGKAQVRNTPAAAPVCGPLFSCWRVGDLFPHAEITMDKHWITFKNS